MYEGKTTGATEKNKSDEAYMAARDTIIYLQLIISDRQLWMPN